MSNGKISGFGIVYKWLKFLVCHLVAYVISVKLMFPLSLSFLNYKIYFTQLF